MPAAKEPPYTKVYGLGWQAMKGLVSLSPTAAKVYMLLAEHSGRDNRVIATYGVLADHLNLCERTIRTAIKILEDGKHIVVYKVGTANLYFVNPEETWKQAHDYKTFCAFPGAVVLVSKKQNPKMVKHLTNRTAGKEAA